MTTLQVVVDQPLIEGDTVRFSWTQSEPNPHQIRNSFFYRYEGIDLSQFRPELFFEIFLSLQLRVFARHDGPVELQFPIPVPAYTAAYWLAYSNASNLTIDPISPVGHYDPWINGKQLIAERRKAAVFFGGGKDSTLATCLLSEIYGRDQVVVVQFVGPLRDDPRLTRFLEERQENLMLGPARERLGVATQRGWTDHQAIFRRSSEHLRPHLELYTAGALPALLAWGVDLCSLGTPWSVMNVERREDGSLRANYANSRPEAIAAQSRHYAVTLGAPITITDMVLPFNSYAAHLMLARRYPSALEHIASCTIAKPTERWCHGCSKCALFAIMSLSSNTPAADFDYDRFFATSSMVRKLIAYAESGVELSQLGNAPWAPGFFSAPQGFILGCHMVSKIDPDNLPVKLGPEAKANLAIWCAMFGNRAFPEWESVPRVTLDLLGPELGPKVTAIVAEHLPILDRLPSPAYNGNSPSRYQFDPPIDIILARLPHIQPVSAER